MGTTGLIYDPRYLEHDMGAGHPESPNRLRAIMQRLEQSGTLATLTRIDPRTAEDEWVTLEHRSEYVAVLNRQGPTHGRISLDADTSMSPGSPAPPISRPVEPWREWMRMAGRQNQAFLALCVRCFEKTEF